MRVRIPIHGSMDPVEVKMSLEQVTSQLEVVRINDPRIRATEVILVPQGIWEMRSSSATSPLAKTKGRPHDVSESRSMWELPPS